MKIPSLRSRRTRIALVFFGSLFLCALATPWLLEWTLKKWLASTPVPHVRLTLNELRGNRGVLEVEPEGISPFLVPFTLQWSFWPPGASLMVSQSWPELSLGPVIAHDPHADVAISVPLWGTWQAGGSFEAGKLKEKATGELFEGRTDVALTARGGVASGTATNGKRKAEWNLTLGPPDFGTALPFDVKGKLKVSDDSASLEADVVLVRDGDLVKLHVTCGECGHATTAFGRAWLGPVDAKATVLAGSATPTFSAEADFAGGISATHFPPLPLTSKFVAQGELGGIANFTLGAQSPQLPWHATIKGSLKRWGEGRADAELPLSFFPELAERPFWKASFPTWDLSSGKLTATSEVEWKDGTVKSVARLYGRGVEGSWQGLPFELDTLRFAGELSPHFRHQGENGLKLKSIGDKIAAKNVELSVGWKNLAAFDIKKATAQFANGRITMLPFTFATLAGRARSKVVAEKIDLAVLAPLLLGPSAQAKGTMTGDIPWLYEKGIFHIEDGIVHNDGPGRISYRDATTAHLPEKVDFLDEFQSILAQGQQVLVMKALQNFDFSVLRLRINRHGGDDMKVELDLKGRNPDLAKGQPFEIVLPVSGKVEPLIKETIWKAFFGDQD